MFKIFVVLTGFAVAVYLYIQLEMMQVRMISRYIED